ncbi:MAG TPA: DUF1501 domain-containing protein [Cytophagaceae bacterium]
MRRRDFLKRLPVLGAIPFTLDGILFNTMSNAAPLQKLAALCNNDRVLIILQLHGGNDGLNMIIPAASHYNLYYNRRPNIAIAESGPRGMKILDSTLPEAQQVGLHPDMTGVKDLYDQGKVSLVQGVSYENHNGSHFRSRDIFFMGGGAGDYINSGWIGRYLKDHYAPLSYPDDFPNTNMPDPLALEFGNDVSLIFHQGDNISTSISIDNPQQFFDLVNSLPGFEDIEGLDPRGVPPESLANSPYGKEMDWILSLEQKTDQYDDRLIEVYNEGKKFDPGITYPTTYPLNAPKSVLNNPIAGPLKIIANLLSGGCKTKVFLVKIGGFDTHAEQVEDYDTSMGNHAALLYHISAAMNAFHKDLKARGLEDRVLTITTSEFGRRVHSNASYGTDHGVGAPAMIFGKYVNPGVLGNNPDLMKDNVEMQYDYRQLYATILKEWFCVDPAKVDAEFGIFWGDYQGRGTTLPLISTSVAGINEFMERRFRMNSCYPNPAINETTFSFFINNNVHVELNILNAHGKIVKRILNEPRSMGEHSILADLRDLKTGTYFYEIKAGILKDTKKLIIVR